VRPVAVGEQHRIGAREHVVIGECAQQLVVAGAGLVRAADDRIDDSQRGRRAEALIGQAVAGAQAVPLRRGVFERARHRRAEGDHAAAAAVRALDRIDRRLRQAVRLVERQPRVECGIARGRDSRSMRQRRESDAARA